MTEKPPVWADWLLTLWVLSVGVFYFGGYFLPAAIGQYTAAASAIYALMLLVSAGFLALRYLRRTDTTNKIRQTEAPKNRK